MLVASATARPSRSAAGGARPERRLCLPGQLSTAIARDLSNPVTRGRGHECSLRGHPRLDETPSEPLAGTSTAHSSTWIAGTPSTPTENSTSRRVRGPGAVAGQRVAEQRRVDAGAVGHGQRARRQLRPRCGSAIRRRWRSGSPGPPASTTSASSAHTGTPVSISATRQASAIRPAERNPPVQQARHRGLLAGDPGRRRDRARSAGRRLGRPAGSAWSASPPRWPRGSGWTAR